MKAYHFNARFIELASEINANMPRYVVGPHSGSDETIPERS